MRLTVRDSGAGIGPELLPNIFDLFVQGQRGVDRSLGGLGLGLPIVRSLVELHGGRVTAHSDGPGRGSELTVLLPLVEIPARPAVAVESSTPPISARVDARRVLVVDDNADAADLLTEALAAAGHETRVAYDGPSALAVAQAFAPAVVLLDIGLPVMDGYELARRLRQLPGLAPRLVAITGYAQESDRRRAREAGFEAHLVKPVAVDQVLRLVEEPLS